MSRIKLNNVRLSFASIFERSTFDGVEGKYSATLLLSKKDPQTKGLIAAIKEAMGKHKIPSDKLCLTDGDTKEYDGWNGHYALKASNMYRPTIVDQQRNALTEVDGVIYAGCYVNAIVEMWKQDNKWGKRVNCTLHGIQFVKDGEAFGQPKIDVTEEFDDVGAPETKPQGAKKTRGRKPKSTEPSELALEPETEQEGDNLFGNTGDTGDAGDEIWDD